MGARVFILGDGTKATVPDESLDKWMQRMDTRGVKFRDADMSGEMTVGEPEVIKANDPSTQPDAPPDGASAAPEQPFSWRGLYDKLTSGGADSDTLARVHDVQPKNGTQAMVENVAGLVTPPILKGASALGRIGAGVVNQGVSGAASGGLNAALEGKDVGQGAGWGAVLGALGGGAGELAGSVVEGAGKLAGGVADRARIAAAGIDANTRKELAKKFGVADLPASIAGLIERVSPSPRLGQNALTRAEGLSARMKEVGPRIDDALREAGDGQGLNAALPESWDVLKSTVAEDAAAARANAVTGGKTQLAGALEAQAGRLGSQPAPSDLVGLRQRNTEWGQDAYGDSLNISDAASRQAAGQLRDAGEAALDDIIERATPETAQAFHQANSDYGEAALLERAARNRGAVESGATTAPGAVAALAAGAVNGVPGLVSGAASGTRGMLTQAIGGTRGLDVIANAARGAGAPLQAAGGAIRAGSNASGELGGRLAAALARQDLTDEERRRLEEEEAAR